MLTGSLSSRMLNFSMVVSGSTAIVYLLDTHGANALHILALSNFSKNMVLYGSTFFANGMVQNRGVTVSLFILAACQGFCWLATIPMYLFGKRVRSYVRSVDFVILAEVVVSNFIAFRLRDILRSSQSIMPEVYHINPMYVP